MVADATAAVSSFLFGGAGTPPREGRAVGAGGLGYRGGVQQSRAMHASQHAPTAFNFAAMYSKQKYAYRQLILHILTIYCWKVKVCMRRWIWRLCF